MVEDNITDQPMFIWTGVNMDDFNTYMTGFSGRDRLDDLIFKMGTGGAKSSQSMALKRKSLLRILQLVRAKTVRPAERSAGNQPSNLGRPLFW